MGRHWGEIREDLHEVHTVCEPVNPVEGHVENAVARQPEANGLKDVLSLVGKPQQQHQRERSEQVPVRPTKEQKSNGDAHTHREDEIPEHHFEHSDSEDNHADLPAMGMEHSACEGELLLVRKVMRTWWRLAGLIRHPSMCEEQGDDFGMHRTKGIAPKLEGRTKIVNGGN